MAVNGGLPVFALNYPSFPGIHTTEQHNSRYSLFLLTEWVCAQGILTLSES